MTTTTYNGWTNYETWAVDLWLRNEEPSYRYWSDVADQIWTNAETDHPVFTGSEHARVVLADRLKDEVSETSPLADDASLWTDLLNGALSEVDWLEIADHWLADCDDYERLDRSTSLV